MASSSSSYLMMIIALLLLMVSSSSATSAPYTPRLSIHPPDILRAAASNNLLRSNEKKIAPASEDGDFKAFFYNQTLNHFNYRPESYATFPQKYFINSKYWSGANSSAPIFVFLDGEQTIDDTWSTIGFLDENSPRFKALQLYIEHRFYGDSDPSDSIKDDNISGYFSSAQALADYAEIILHIKKKLNAENSPVIVFGGSYGGMLAAYFRLKYPHIAHGALASSAPVLLFNNFVPHYGYADIVSKDFKKTSQSCYDTIKGSWDEIDRVASEPDGLVTLRKMFKICEPWSADQLKYFLVDLYSNIAQYNLPWNRIATLCSCIDNSSSDSTSSALSKTANGVVSLLSLLGSNSSCILNSVLSLKARANQTLLLGWNWQVCTEFPYWPASGNNTMFQPNPAPVQLYVDKCMSTYNIAPRPYWVSTYYGGKDMKSVLREFGSNIIFANGLADPFSNGGILEDLSNTIRAVYTIKGSHCLDLLPSRTDDPKWLVKQRKTEVNIITKWLNKYYANLKQCPS